MSDNRSSAGGQDRARISLSQDFDARDASRTFGVSDPALRDAVDHVGDRTEDVECDLAGQG